MNVWIRLCLLWVSLCYIDSGFPHCTMSPETPFHKQLVTPFWGWRMMPHLDEHVNNTICLAASRQHSLINDLFLRVEIVSPVSVYTVNLQGPGITLMWGETSGHSNQGVRSLGCLMWEIHPKISHPKSWGLDFACRMGASWVWRQCDRLPQVPVHPSSLHGARVNLGFRKVSKIYRTFYFKNLKFFQDAITQICKQSLGTACQLSDKPGKRTVFLDSLPTKRTFTSSCGLWTTPGELPLYQHPKVFITP